MTEAKWLACTDPHRMLKSLRGKVSNRKLRLFAVGWYQQTVGGALDGSVQDWWSEAAHATVEACRHAIETSERLADGLSSEAERAAAEAALRRLPDWGNYDLFLWYMRALALWAVSTHGRKLSLAPEAPYAAGFADAGNARDRSQQTVVLRDIFCGPFRSVTFPPASLTPTVISLAQTIYLERASERMPELANTLEQAGCRDLNILEHCRGAGPHIRGCWVVDLVLGKS